MADSKPEVDCISETGGAIDAIHPHIFHHAQFTKVTGDIVRQLLQPYIDMADTKPEVFFN